MVAGRRSEMAKRLCTKPAGARDDGGKISIDNIRQSVILCAIQKEDTVCTRKNPKRKSVYGYRSDGLKYLTKRRGAPAPAGHS